MPAKRHTTLFFLMALFWAAMAFGQDRPIILEHADHGESHWHDEKLVTTLLGDVQFVSGSMALRGDRATWYQDDGMVVFEGQVSLVDTAQMLWADRLTYLQEEGKASADGQVTLVDSVNNLVLTAGHLEYQREERIARAALEPRLVIQWEDESEPVVIKGRTMTLFSRERRAVVTDQVVITRGQLKANCGRAVYLDLEDQILLEEKPVAEEDKSSLQGDEMVLYLQDEEIKKIEVKGNAYGEYVQQVDSTGQHLSRHRVTAQKIAFYLAEERVERITAQDNATSLYLPSGEELPRRGENQTSGDRLEIFLDQERVERALVEGGALGYYVPPGEGEVTDTLKYGSQKIDYALSREEISLTEDAFLDYGQISLSAYQIVYNTQTEILTAQQRSFSEEETQSEQGRPILKDGEKELVGSHMVYSLKTQRGKVIEGQTDFEKGHYRGTSIRKVEEDILKADHGMYTTCELEENSHYHFYSRRMKIILKDKVIAKPVILYIHRIPVMILPFYVFPIKPGRHSGFLIPRYGSTDFEGRYLKNVGYYLAPSQYWDATLSMDLYERTGWLLRLNGQYAIRYLLRGNLSGSYKWDERYVGTVLQKRRRWDLQLNHSQSLSPTWQLQANGTFIGENDRSYYRDISDDPYQRMNRNLHSYLSLDKSWSNSKANIAFDQRWDLDQDVTIRYLPTISFQRFEAPIYRKKAPGKTLQPQEQPWYSSVYYRYSARFINYLKDWSEEEDGHTVDKHEEHQALDQSLSLRVPLNLFGHLALSPSATYRETWFDRDKLGHSFSKKFVRRGDYDASVGARTTLYGLVRPRLGALVAIRHVLKPSLSFSWRPDFKDRDDYYAVPFIHSVGGPHKTLGIGLANQFQAKIRRGEKERNYTLADLDFNTSYNFRAETRKLANLTSSLRVHPSSRFNITVGARHDFYEANTNRLRPFSPRLLSFSIDSRLTLRGTGFGQQVSPIAGTKGWRLNLSHRYSETRTGGGLRRSSWLSGNMSFNLTAHWRIDYTGRYDVVEKKFISQRIEFYRDLHCWEARFVWEPTGIREGYYVRVNIKAIPEIKLERAKGVRTY
jgi:lipopolysaccharide assembly outer membrane protein LptD (OstA)